MSFYGRTHAKQLCIKYKLCVTTIMCMYSFLYVHFTNIYYK